MSDEEDTIGHQPTAPRPDKNPRYPKPPRRSREVPSRGHSVRTRKRQSEKEGVSRPLSAPIDPSVQETTTPMVPPRVITLADTDNYTDTDHLGTVTPRDHYDNVTLTPTSLHNTSLSDIDL